MLRILLVFFLIAPSIADAQRNLVVAGESRVALVIGNGAYKDSPLANPANDAADIAKALSQFGFKVILKRNVGTSDMRRSIREFGAELRRAQVGLFYFAGHGVQLKGENYLVPVGAEIESEAEAEDLAINTGLVLRTMEESQVKVSIVILDACRNNPFARSFRSSARGLAQMNAATGSLIAFATAPGSVAADGAGRNGTYTKHLLASFNHADSDILKVFQRTRAGVVKETGGKQTPWESTSLVGDFHFRLATPGAGPNVTSAAPTATTDPVALEVDFWNSVKDTKNPDELKAYLEQYPQGRYAGLARARLKAIGGAPATAVASASTPPAEAPKPPRVAGGAAAGAIAAQVLGQQTKATVIGQAATQARPGASFRDCQVCPEMVTIPPGSFLMGSPMQEPGRLSSEGPQHRVTIARSFAVGKYEVTFDEWEACKHDGGCRRAHTEAFYGKWGRGRQPVGILSWQHAKEYVDWLSRKTGKTYRLLTEAEWEYVARAGSTTAFSWGNSITPQHANYYSTRSYAGSPTATREDRTVEVGKYAPNAFGLYDVHGNASEWVEDCWNENYDAAVMGDGSARTSGDCARRVLRGGAWNSPPDLVRSATRSHYRADGFTDNFASGLRVARTD